ncbi:MAG: aminotransferase class III-fold pyridoxal phosphate-dependent enzyme [bacterium]|nr:aminotransferase class III-fold pyridoxal phosphate-dependent enzyme [bacterium]
MAQHDLFELFCNDPKVQASLSDLLGHLERYQSQLVDSPSVPGISETQYKRELTDLAENRGGNLFFPYISSGLGSGSKVALRNGKVMTDLIGGIGVNFSHAHPEVVRDALLAAMEDSVMQGNLQHNHKSAQLIQRLCELSGLDHAFLSTSGAMAAENGLKIAFQKHAPSTRVLAFSNCFMGRTLGLAQVTDKPLYRVGLPPTISVDYIPFYDASCHKESIARSVKALREHISRFPGQHAVFCMELVQGEGGFYPGHRDFFLALIAEAKAAGMAILVDEIQTFGRLTSMFAFHHFKLSDVVDIVTIGKMAHVCGTLFKAEYKPNPGLISQTFTSSSVAIASSLRLLALLETGGFYGTNGKIAKLHRAFKMGLEALHKKYPKSITGPFGIGSMIAVTVFEGNKDHSLALLHTLFDKGIMAFLTGGSPTRLRFLLPIGGMTPSDIPDIMAILEAAIIETAADKKVRLC